VIWPIDNFTRFILLRSPHTHSAPTPTPNNDLTTSTIKSNFYLLDSPNRIPNLLSDSTSIGSLHSRPTPFKDGRVYPHGVFIEIISGKILQDGDGVMVLGSGDLVRLDNAWSCIESTNLIWRFDLSFAPGPRLHSECVEDRPLVSVPVFLTPGLVRHLVSHERDLLFLSISHIFNMSHYTLDRMSKTKVRFMATSINEDIDCLDGLDDHGSNANSYRLSKQHMGRKLRQKNIPYKYDVTDEQVFESLAYKLTTYDSSSRRTNTAWLLHISKAS